MCRILFIRSCNIQHRPLSISTSPQRIAGAEHQRLRASSALLMASSGCWFSSWASAKVSAAAAAPRLSPASG